MHGSPRADGRPATGQADGEGWEENRIPRNGCHVTDGHTAEQGNFSLQLKNTSGLTHFTGEGTEARP